MTIKGFQYRLSCLVTMCMIICLLTGCTLRADLMVNNLSSHQAAIYNTGGYAVPDGKDFPRLIAVALAKQQQVFPKVTTIGAYSILVAMDENNKPLQFKAEIKDDYVYMEVRNRSGKE